MMPLLQGIERAGAFEPSLVHQWLKPSISGNVINGLGETRERRPTPVYHRMHKHPWFGVQMYFYIRQTWDWVQQFHLRRGGKFMSKQPAYGSDVALQRERDTARNWSSRVKAQALSHAFCDEVGIADLNPGLFFDGDYKEGDEHPKWIVVLAKRMNYDDMQHHKDTQDWWKVPVWKRKFLKPQREVIRCYADTLEAAESLADWIRARGYPAEIAGGAICGKINVLKSAIEAGLGELGKHGSLISDELGSSIRFAVVLTDMPLVDDGERNFGADAFCNNCQLCTTNCPPKAISDSKQMVRGVEKWYVDFDKCVPYFNDTMACGICLTVCPWSRPGVAPNLAKKMLKKRQARTAPAADVAA